MCNAGGFVYIRYFIRMDVEPFKFNAVSFNGGLT